MTDPKRVFPEGGLEVVSFKEHWEGKKALRKV